MEGRSIMATTYQLLTRLCQHFYFYLFTESIKYVSKSVCLNITQLDWILQRHILKSFPICSRAPKALVQTNSVMRQAPFLYWNTHGGKSLLYSSLSAGSTCRSIHKIKYSVIIKQKNGPGQLGSSVG